MLENEFIGLVENEWVNMLIPLTQVTGFLSPNAVDLMPTTALKRAKAETGAKNAHYLIQRDKHIGQYRP